LDLKKLYGKVRNKANVIGFSSKLQPRIKQGRVIPEELCLRIYVSKKLPLAQLRTEDVVPSVIDGIPVDVVEIGEVKALSGSVDRTGFFRPLVMGISVSGGNVTAGTLSIPFKDSKGNVYLSSNSHVLCDNPSIPPEQVTNKVIKQPGNYDIRNHGWDVNDPKYVVGEYFWHQQVYPIGSNSGCSIAKVWSGVYNALARAFKRKTRLVPIVEVANKIDFALFKPSVEYKLEVLELDISDKKFVGLLFAGSSESTIICKASNIVETGYTPVIEYSDAKVNDIIFKSGRTSAVTKGTVLDDSGNVMVDYETFEAWFEDIIIATTISQPGDSGSACFVRCYEAGA
jgi:hypothetical protein